MSQEIQKNHIQRCNKQTCLAQLLQPQHLQGSNIFCFLETVRMETLEKSMTNNLLAMKKVKPLKYRAAQNNVNH
jgi:hypothetical protein